MSGPATPQPPEPRWEPWKPKKKSGKKKPLPQKGIRNPPSEYKALIHEIRDLRAKAKGMHNAATEGPSIRIQRQLILRKIADFKIKHARNAQVTEMTLKMRGLAYGIRVYSPTTSVTPRAASGGLPSLPRR